MFKIGEIKAKEGFHYHIKSDWKNISDRFKPLVESSFKIKHTGKCGDNFITQGNSIYIKNEGSIIEFFAPKEDNAIVYYVQESKIHKL